MRTTATSTTMAATMTARATRRAIAAGVRRRATRVGGGSRPSAPTRARAGTPHGSSSGLSRSGSSSTGSGAGGSAALGAVEPGAAGDADSTDDAGQAGVMTAAGWDGAVGVSCGAHLAGPADRSGCAAVGCWAGEQGAAVGAGTAAGPDVCGAGRAGVHPPVRVGIVTGSDPSEPGARSCSSG